ncbi:ABC transporter ATP-binding protein [Marinilactibacillus psychrotolerans]|uniref:ABC transporter ATP-binding protein n=2 Tax=Marinilactibacillus psychrotolerans TaxID=191770 RepID=A0A511GYT2_9LACT|nr:ABC transporter ATP-binding protein [Marinilactibacillus psychrotolerans]TLQ06876.1 ABC transporter ATP-binding protein [Marinilactibacillus psychrotolerans]SDC55644.1 ABC-2 type transport system ATP-binding protein [Marinilactibacillus psychrotolerans]SJN24104.1 ABC transporter ATP-binding protein [Marinilactibacillus psychrotolerans 42ea]GEL66430.1 ABC transporter [Marinilactibacillus psychrotolerans]GEQ33989.1 ABC transporter ATP-binding protein [Marinilactibacillus psychrotolerans]
METILEMREVKKSFGGNHVLKGVNFSVHPGEIIGYIGPNGAGKSTTVKIILGMLQQDAGEIMLFGRSLAENGDEYKARIGYVPENAELYETLSAEEYLLFVGRLYGMDEQIVRQKSFSMMKILGIESAFKNRLSSFSKGMRQKVLIISSLLHNPDILFWDEPLNGLDANSVQIVKEILSELKKDGKTIFYSSHIMDTVEKLSDRIIILNNGTVVADGPFAELQKDADGTLEQLFNQLTGFNEYAELAADFVTAMKGESQYDA